LKVQRDRTEGTAQRNREILPLDEYLQIAGLPFKRKKAGVGALRFGTLSWLPKYPEKETAPHCLISNFTFRPFEPKWDMKTASKWPNLAVLRRERSY
jgi:hypothetical protein